MGSEAKAEDGSGDKAAGDKAPMLVEAETQAGDGMIPLSLEEIKGCNVGEMAKDKFKSRQLQRSLTRGGKEHIELIFEKTQPHIAELVCDQHGNYLIQKLLEVISDDQFDIVFNTFKDELLTMAKDTHGTRAVQKIVEQAKERKRVDQILQALPAEMAEELARHITGFHVVVKMVDSLPPVEAEDLLLRLCGDPEKVRALGKDQWGCCVLKKCIDRAEYLASVEPALRTEKAIQTKEGILSSIVTHTLDLVQDAFGNYVVQHLFNPKPIHPDTANITRIVDALKGHICKLSLQKYSSNVLEKILGTATEKDKNKIINEILNPPELKPSEAVRKLLYHQFGNYVIQQALEVAKDPQFSLLIEHSKQSVQELYIEATKQPGQGEAVAPVSAGPQGSLPAEHSQRLAVKLVKKYPVFTEGMEMDMSQLMVGMDAAWMFDYDPMGYGYGYLGFDPYGYPMPLAPFDPNLAFGAFAFPAEQKAGKGGRGSQGGRGQKSKQGKKGRGQKGGGGTGSNASPAGEGGETVKVGRMVGFWPDYYYVEDEVPTGNQRTGKRGKPKGKAAASS